MIQTKPFTFGHFPSPFGHHVLYDPNAEPEVDSDSILSDRAMAAASEILQESLKSNLPVLLTAHLPHMPMARGFALQAKVESEEEDEVEEESDDDGLDPEARKSLKILVKSANGMIYKCPRIGCPKAYKNQNGLKYHFTTGTCTGIQPPPRVHSNMPTPQPSQPNSPFGRPNITPPRDTSRPLTNAEKRPHYCRICLKRYRNSNGLKYHAAADHPNLDFDRDVKGKSTMTLVGEKSARK